MSGHTLYTSYLHRLHYFLAAVLLLHLTAFATPAFIPLPKAKLVSRFPFVLTTRGIIIIKGHFGNFKDTLNFVLDTGSGGISLDSARAQQFNLTATPVDGTIKGLSQQRTAAFVHGQQLHLPKLQVNNLDFHINNYSFLSVVHNIQIDGVIGYSLLKSYIVKINYDDLRIEIWTSGTIDYPKEGYVLKTRANKLAAINAQLSDNRKIESNFYLDTGADICFLLSNQFVKDSSVLSNDKKKLLSFGEGLGGKKEMQLTTVNEIHIGPYAFKKVPVYIFEDTYNVSNYPTTGGLIGNELMQRFNVIINYPADEIYLKPNAMFNSPFNYSYVGCTIFEENGKAVIDDIIKDSPAQLAGLKNGDIIYGINNNFRNDIEEYRRLFLKTGSKLKVFLLRGDKITSTIVEVKSFL